MAKCAACGKSVSHGNKISIARSHVSRRSTRTWSANLRMIKAVIDGETKKVPVCAKCLRSGKLKRA